VVHALAQRMAQWAPDALAIHAESTASSVSPGRYRHFKGKLYDVHGVAADTETGAQYVVYTAVDDRGHLWVRPLEIFLETVVHEGHRVSRFRLVHTAAAPRVRGAAVAMHYLRDWAIKSLRQSSS
jgi:hypothetical protein